MKIVAHTEVHIVQRYVSGGIVLEGNLWDTLSQKKYIHAIR
jgi:hypothetical protein